MHDEARQPSGRFKLPTLEDVAARAGVSRAHVSIILRGVPGASAKTRDRVLAVAAEMGYRSDIRARLLASSNSSRVLAVVFTTFGTFHLELLDGIYAAADAAGYDVILCAVTPNRSEQRAVETVMDFRCDAVILFGPETVMPKVAGRLPVVVVGWRVKDRTVDVVRTSDDQGAKLAVDHLVELGHQQIAFVDGGRSPVSSARRRSYRAAMRTHSLEQHIRVVPGGFNQEHGTLAARQLIADGPLPTAVIAHNDDIAVGILETFRSTGILVPDDMSIVGWNDDTLARMPHVRLTTVVQDTNQMARLAVERSVARVIGTRFADNDIVLPARLIVRGSTGQVRPDPPDQ